MPAKARVALVAVRDSVRRRRSRDGLAVPVDLHVFHSLWKVPVRRLGPVFGIQNLHNLHIALFMRVCGGFNNLHIWVLWRFFFGLFLALGAGCGGCGGCWAGFWEIA